MDSTHTVVARFDGPREARDAMLDLEMRGIDAGAIHLASPKPPLVTNDEVLSKNVEVSGSLAWRGAKGALLGALVGATVLIAVLSIARVEPLGSELIIGALSGATGGAIVGAYWAVAVRVPVNEDVFDTYVVDEVAPQGVLVEVRVDDARKAAEAVTVLRRHHPQQIDREVA